MPNIENAVDEYDGKTSSHIGYQKIMGRMIFYVKIGNIFSRKDRFLDDDHMTETSSSITYSMVMSYDSVIFF